MKREPTNHSERGFVLVSTVLLITVFLTLLAAYFTTTNIETATVRDSKGASSGFFSAEAGLNLRAETIRQVFVGFNQPSGTVPNPTNPCTGANVGSGSYQCISYNFNNRTVNTYIARADATPTILTIPPGERYQNLSAQEYRYTAKAQAYNPAYNHLEADLELRFKSRLVPLFQFAAFYNKDLEILPGPAMTLAGPVHTNGDLYLYSNSANLDISGQVTAAGGVWRGRKDGSISPSCNNRPVRVLDPSTLRTLIPTCPARYQVTSTDIQPFNNMIQHNVQAVTVPGPDVFDPTPGKIYWDRADLRVVLRMDASNNPAAIEVRNVNDTVNSAATTTLTGCAGVVSGRAVGHTQIYNYREAKWVRLLDLDVLGTFNCLKNSNWFGTGKLLSDITEGGIVFHLTVKGPQSANTANNYGVRLRNGARLYSSASGAPNILGFTVVSDQAAYVLGDFNSVNKKPAAVMADSLNVLSSNWNSGAANAGSDASSNGGLGNRVAATTTINCAFLAGTDSTGGTEGIGGQTGAYNGGLENYPRFHEDWSGRVFTYRGSFVSLGRPQHVRGAWGAQSYSPPNRDWNYDTSFNVAANLPPITPRFVYLRQELFVRDFER
jgi:Tfp pilus assembly protein PilX